MVPVVRPVPDLRVRVWGGNRLAAMGAATAGSPAAPAGRIGESWVAGPTSTLSGDLGRTDATLEALAGRLGRELVGRASPWPDRFPLLVKLLDPAAWLSVQVHPDDATALRLAGPGAVGKSESWYVLDAAAGAELLVGVRPGVSADQVRAGIRGGGLAGLLERVTPSPGDTILVPAGTLHSVGPGVFLYELQQPSDLTYRADDWGRPATPERPLHVTETLASWDPAAAPLMRHSTADRPPARRTLVACPYFVMERLVVDASRDGALTLDPAGASPHVLTALPGSRLTLECAGWREELGPLETAVVPAGAGPYKLAAAGAASASALLARLPG